MRLQEMTVEGFRSIKNCSVSFDEINAVIGENNAGKTALLRALNSVFNWQYEEHNFLNNRHQYSPRARTKIILTFDAIADKEIYRDKIENGKMILQLTYAYGNTTRKKTLTILKHDGENIQVNDDFIVELKKDIDYVYIPAGRNSSDLEWGRDSIGYENIFTRTISTYAKALIQSRDTISNRVETVSEAFKNKVFVRLEKELEEAGMLESSEKYKLGFSDGIDYTIFLDHVNLNIEESNRILPIKEYGSGIKSLSVIALYRAFAKLSGVNVILGIEEPETNLHPHAQKKLIASLKDNRQDQEIQAIFATHSTVIIDELDHEDIILARRVKDLRRGFHTEYTQLKNSFWSDYHLDEYKHNTFFRYKNSEFFFARYVIITESTTDAQVVDELIKDMVGDKIFRISILNLDGVKNLKYPYFLLKELGIPFSMVVDRDVLSNYRNNELEQSRDTQTFLPLYQATLGWRNPVLKDLWVTEAERNSYEENLSNSYSKLFTYCKQKHLLTMQYCLEMDLVANKASRTAYCNEFNLRDDDTAYYKLLIEKKDAIKSPEKIIRIVKQLRPADYPYSFKKIRAELIAEIENKVEA